MTGRRCADDVCMCGQHADDVPACGQRVDNVRMTYVIRQPKSPTKSHSRVIRMSSTHHLHVIHASYARHTHKTSVPRLFQVKQQRAALLKSNILTAYCDSIPLKIMKNSPSQGITEKNLLSKDTSLQTFEDNLVVPFE